MTGQNFSVTSRNERRLAHGRWLTWRLKPAPEIPATFFTRPTSIPLKFPRRSNISSHPARQRFCGAAFLPMCEHLVGGSQERRDNVLSTDNIEMNFCTQSSENWIELLERAGDAA